MMLLQKLNRSLLVAGCVALAVISARADVTPAMPGVFDVKSFGALGDGHTSDTAALNKAIAACAAAGGGRVLVPAGTYSCGPLQLKSEVDLHLADGALIRFSRERSDYPLIRSNFEGHDAVVCSSPLMGDGLQNVSITGQGVFDGSGDIWRPTQQAKMPPADWKALIDSGGVVDPKKHTWYPDDTAAHGAEGLTKLIASGSTNLADFEPYRVLLRPPLVMLSNIHHLRLDGVTFRNSGSWNVHLMLCSDVAVHGVTIFNPIWAQNGDGIDVDSCRNVSITACDIKAGDDVICLKSGRDEAGRTRGVPTENVTISDCTLGWGHGGITIGSEMSGGVRNVDVSNCVLDGTDGGLRFKTTRGRGGVVENVNIRNIEMKHLREGAITFNMYYMVKTPVPEPVSDRTPQFRQFHISNISCDGARTALELHGLPEMPLDEITIENSRFTTDHAGFITDAHDVTLRDVHIVSSDKVELRNTPGLSLTRTDGFSADASASLDPADPRDPSLAPAASLDYHPNSRP